MQPLQFPKPVYACHTDCTPSQFLSTPEHPPPAPIPLPHIPKPHPLETRAASTCTSSYRILSTQEYPPPPIPRPTACIVHSSSACMHCPFFFRLGPAPCRAFHSGPGRGRRRGRRRAAAPATAAASGSTPGRRTAKGSEGTGKGSKARPKGSKGKWGEGSEQPSQTLQVLWQVCNRYEVGSRRWHGVQ